MICITKLFALMSLVVVAGSVLACPPVQDRQLEEWVKDLERGKRRTDYADEREPRYRALRAFREMGSAASPAIPALTKLLHNEQTAPEAAAALVSIGPKSIDVLTKALAAKSPEVRLRAAYALGELEADAQSAVPALLALVQNSDESDIVRTHAIWALGRIGKEPALVVPVLISLLKSPNDALRKSAAFAVGGFRQDAKNAIHSLESLLDDKDRLVRHWAAQSLKQIQGTKVDPVPK